MRAIVRVDAATAIGTGHVMRCLALAHGIRQRGGSVLFVTLPLPGNMDDHIRRLGFDVTSRMPSSGDWHWLVVDHYLLDRDFEVEYRGLARRILAIDDLANRAHECDLLLDQNMYFNMRHRYAGLVPAEARQLLGPKWALLRQEFADAHLHARPRTRIERILVFFGGSDPTDETSKVLQALAKVGLRGIRIDVLVGAANQRRSFLEVLASRVEGCFLLDHTDEMARLMNQADLSLGAGGSTSWERCCLGLPALVVAVAKNQVAISEALAAAGCLTFLGMHDKVSVESLELAIRSAVDEFEPHAAAGVRGLNLVDGLGVSRVLDQMEAT